VALPPEHLAFQLGEAMQARTAAAAPRRAERPPLLCRPAGARPCTASDAASLAACTRGGPPGARAGSVAPLVPTALRCCLLARCEPVVYRLKVLRGTVLRGVARALGTSAVRGPRRCSRAARCRQRRTACARPRGRPRRASRATRLPSSCSRGARLEAARRAQPPARLHTMFTTRRAAPGGAATALGVPRLTGLLKALS